MKSKCHKCKHEWDYKGSRKPIKDINIYVTCPKCKTNVKLEELRC